MDLLGCPAADVRAACRRAPRSHAVQSSPVRRLDHRPHPQRRRPHRASNRSALRAHLGAQAAPRTRLPILPWHPAPGASVRCRTCGGRRYARYRDRRAHLWIGPFHPRSQARSARRAQARGRRADPPSQHPRLTLLPLRRPNLAHPSNPRSASSTRTQRHGQGLR